MAKPNPEFLPGRKNSSLKKGGIAMKVKSNVKAGRAIWGA
jgi:hypothetical protein